MKTIVIALCVCVAAVAYAEEGQYTSRFDNVDLDKILNNDRLLKSYIDCLLTGKRCSPDGAELKKLLPDALATECSKCTDKQKEGSKKIIKFLTEKKPTEWEKILDKYDTDHVYRNKYAAEAKEQGIKV